MDDDDYGVKPVGEHTCVPEDTCGPSNERFGCGYCISSEHDVFIFQSATFAFVSHFVRTFSPGGARGPLLDEQPRALLRASGEPGLGNGTAGSLRWTSESARRQQSALGSAWEWEQAFLSAQAPSVQMSNGHAGDMRHFQLTVSERAPCLCSGRDPVGPVSSDHPERRVSGPPGSLGPFSVQCGSDADLLVDPSGQPDARGEEAARDPPRQAGSDGQVRSAGRNEFFESTWIVEINSESLFRILFKYNPVVRFFRKYRY